MADLVAIMMILAVAATVATGVDYLVTAWSIVRGAKRPAKSVETAAASSGDAPTKPPAASAEPAGAGLPATTAGGEASEGTVTAGGPPSRPAQGAPASTPTPEEVKPTRPVEGWPDAGARSARPPVRPPAAPIPARDIHAPGWEQLRTVRQTPPPAVRTTDPVRPTARFGAPKAPSRPADSGSGPGKGSGTTASAAVPDTTLDAAQAAAEARLAELKRRIGWSAAPPVGEQGKG